MVVQRLCHLGTLVTLLLKGINAYENLILWHARTKDADQTVQKHSLAQCKCYFIPGNDKS